MNILRIKGKCPKGGIKLFVDENGKPHACRLQRYIYTAQYLECNVLKFDDTIINLKKQIA